MTHVLLLVLLLESARYFAIAGGAFLFFWMWGRERWRPRLILIEDVVQNLKLHHYLSSRGYRWFRRTGINSWYVPADAPDRIGPAGWLQFVRKYYLGLPFRILRDKKRRLLRQ